MSVRCSSTSWPHVTCTLWPLFTLPLARMVLSYILATCFNTLDHVVVGARVCTCCGARASGLAGSVLRSMVERRVQVQHFVARLLKTRV